MKAKAHRTLQKKLSRDTIKSIDEEIDRLKSNVTVDNFISCLKGIAEVRKKAKATEYREGLVETYLASAMIKLKGYGVAGNEVSSKDFRTALRLAERFSYRRGIAYAKMGIARIELIKGGESAESMYAATEVLAFARKDKDEYLEWTALRTLSNIFSKLGEISRGYSLFEEALTIAEKRGIAMDIVLTITDGASTLLAPVLYEKHLRRAAELATTGDVNNYVKSFVFIKYKVVLLHLGRISECDAYIDLVRKLLPTLRPSQEGEIRACIGSSYLERGRIQEAEQEFRRALELGLLPEMALYVNAEMGRMFAKSDPQKALRYFEEGLQFSNQYIDFTEASRIHGYLAEFYSSIGELGKASEQYALYKQITEANKTKESRQRAEYAEMILRFDETQKHEKQLEEEVEEKSAALASKAMLLAEQTELLSNFRNDLRAILRKVEGNDPAINEIRKKLRELPEAVNWSEFEEQFQSVHPEFQTMLSANYPSLSKMELKNCVLVRLGLNSREISKLLFLSKRTAEWHRHNIRLKLGIKPDADVAQFLQRM